MAPLRSLPEASTLAERPGAAAPELVTHALTVQGPQQARAMLSGRKLIENRSWRIPPGWYALHVGNKSLEEALGRSWVERLRAAWPDAPPEQALPRGALVGLLRLEEGRRPSRCPPGDLWAVGPLCHPIAEALALARPVRHHGSQGLWPIPEPARVRLAEQAAAAAAEVLKYDLSSFPA